MNTSSSNRFVESDEQWKFLFDQLPSLVWRTDTEANSIWFNKPWLEFRGRTMEDEIGKGWIEGMHPDDLESSFEVINHSFTHMLPFQIEHRLKHHTGKYRWVRCIGKPFYNSTGEYAGYMGNGYDIHESKLLEEKLKESKAFIDHLNEELEQKVTDRTIELMISEANLKEAQRISKLGNWEYDVITGKIKWSEELFRIHGIDPSQGEPDFISLQKNYVNAEELMEHVRKAVEQSIPYQFDAEILACDGTHKMTQAIGRPIVDENGKCIKLYGTTIDITERKKAEEVIKRSEQQLNIITNSVAALIAYVDNQEKYQFVNKQYCKWFGDDAQILFKGKLIAEVLGEFNYVQIKKHIDSALNGVAAEFETVVSDKWGMKHNAMVKYIPDISEDGNVRGFFSLVMDITELKKSQEDLKIINIELNFKNTELTAINNDLDNFIYTASHDLKAPISNIEGLLNTMKDIVESDKFQKSHLLPIASMMEHSVNRFKTTIKDLSEITKVQKNVGEEIEKVYFEDIFEEVKATIAELIKGSGSKIITEFTLQDGIYFSKKNMRSILYNLTSNAIKYRSSERPSEIFIKTEVIDNQVLLSVKDNGLGLPAKNQDKIFKMFKRLHDHVEGTGVGLYIVKRIVDNAGGRIEVESLEGEYSIFKIYFPIH
jgi:PAS domain S-box-containing protein